MILHPQLKKDCFIIGRFELSALLLLNDSQYPWFILVPQREDATEIYQLSPQDQQQLTRESALLAQALSSAFQADKINIAALGNMVPQLHMHHIARYQDDVAWPKPVWGLFPSIPYTTEELEAVTACIQRQLPMLQSITE